MMNRPDTAGRNPVETARAEPERRRPNNPPRPGKNKVLQALLTTQVILAAPRVPDSDAGALRTVKNLKNLQNETGETQKCLRS